MPAPIAVQTSSSKPIISFRSAAAVPMPARLLPLELDPSIKQGRSRLPASAVTEARLVRITFLLF